MAGIRTATQRRQASATSVALLCCVSAIFGFTQRTAYVSPTDGGRRGFLAGAVGAAVATGAEQSAWGFAPSDLGMADAPKTSIQQRKKSNNELQDALYLISRVQEATAQQERIVTTGKFKDMQRNNIKMALNMMLNNYRLGDQIVVASAYASGENNMKASQAGRDAIEVLETAQEYFSKDLKVAGLTDTQRTFIIDAMKTTRVKLDSFLTFMPDDTVNAARKQVEDENSLNMQEYASPDGDNAGIMNPVTLPWKKS